MMPSYAQGQDALNVHVLSVALIGPEAQRRQAVAMVLAGSQATVTREFSAYPQLDDVPPLLDAGYDVIIVDLDSDQERALDLVEYICGNSPVTVMVYSKYSDPEMLVRCMRAGAREYLIQPIASNTITEALVRASVRRPVKHTSKKTLGKLLVFAGAKGGSGVSTVAGNFAVSLARESCRNTLLIDLALPLGAAALNLGIAAQFSTVNALQNISRLDSHFLSTLLVKHSSGLSVLASPDQYMPINVSDEAIAKLIAVGRQDFDYVVIDAGSGAGVSSSALVEGATTVYLVTQVSISELRNANRMISEIFAHFGPRLEIVLNRYSPSSVGIDEENIVKALTRPVTWKIPSDYRAVQRAQNTATPLAQGDSPVAAVICQMARTACGLPAIADKKRKFSLFG